MSHLSEPAINELDETIIPLTSPDEKSDAIWKDILTSKKSPIFQIH